MASDLFAHFGFKGKDLRGSRFGFLTVIDMQSHVTGVDTKWVCKCDCGNTAIKSKQSLTTSATWQSCGCKHGQWKVRHGLCRKREKPHPIYVKWGSMLKRCYDESSDHYHRYGGRGITVCERWHTFANFAEDMLPSWEIGMQIDRIDVNGNYCPDNCRWATADEQANNRGTNRTLTLNGKTQSASMWARELHVPPMRIIARLNLGWSDEDALLRPGRKTTLTYESHSGEYIRSRSHAKKVTTDNARSQIESLE